LEAINKELEAFSYSVSHDLRAPLRSIRGFSEVLLQRYATKLDTRGQDFLQRICSASQQMDDLIEDLLRLSRVSRSELVRRSVDLSALAESIATTLCQAEPKRAVKFILKPGLQAQGDERLLRIVLENLLRNAWKFTLQQPEPRIEFGSVAGPGPTFFVGDNGAGFDMAYADRLFGVFQRLHSATEFPGVGVGLATVQRIINRHGGRVWAQGVVNHGATFYFTLPAGEDVLEAPGQLPR
jgi:light-regulated signal transduction histidine kinase (bacteriophytochrome)